MVQNGVDNIDVKLEWVRDIDNGTLYDMVFERQRPGETATTRIASRTFNSGFTVVDQYVNDYDVRLTAILTLKNVDNNEEYIYIIRLGYITNQYLGLADQVAVVVYGKKRIFSSCKSRNCFQFGCESVSAFKRCIK